MTGTNKWFFVMLAAGMATVACGDSGSGGSSAGGGGSGATGSGAAGSGAAGPGSTGPGTGGGMECGPGSIDMNDACEVCAGNNCTAEALACCEKPGCLDVIACVQMTMCDTENPVGPNGCYTPENCQAEIDVAGLDVAMGEATALGECAAANCATECGLGGAGGAGGGM